jgi:hypothetical protein
MAADPEYRQLLQTEAKKHAHAGASHWWKCGHIRSPSWRLPVYFFGIAVSLTTWEDVSAGADTTVAVQRIGCFIVGLAVGSAMTHGWWRK